MHHTKHGVNGDSTACMWHKIKAREMNVGFHSGINDCVCVQLHDCSIVQCAERLAAAACIPRDHVAEHGLSLLLQHLNIGLRVMRAEFTAFLSFISVFRLLRQDFSAKHMHMH